MINRPLVETVKDLTMIRSTSERPGELRRALNRLVEIIQKAAPTLTIEHFLSNGKPSILAYKGKVRPKKFKVILNGHLDVVPAADEQFVAIVRKDRLYGRGTLDMKGAAVVMADVFCKLAPELDYALGLQMVTDEEIGGHNGTKYQIDQGVAAEVIICGELTPPATICNESRGICQFRAVFEGKTAHSAYPWDGQNAIVAANQYISKLLEYYPVPAAKTWQTTASISNISTTNTTMNQVPNSATVEIDIRYVPGDARFADQQKAMAFLRQIDPSALIEVLMFEPSHHADSQDILVQQLAAAVEKSWSAQTQFIQKPGAADGRFYSEKGILAVILGLQGEGLHGDNEYLELTSLERYQRILIDFLQSLRAS